MLHHILLYFFLSLILSLWQVPRIGTRGRVQGLPVLGRKVGCVGYSPVPTQDICSHLNQIEGLFFFKLSRNKRVCDLYNSKGFEFTIPHLDLQPHIQSASLQK